MADLLQPYDPPRKLRSADKQLISQSPCRLKSYDDRAFWDTFINILWGIYE